MFGFYCNFIKFFSRFKTYDLTNINTNMSQAELKEKIRQFNASLQLQQQELQLKRDQLAAQTDLSNRELDEKIRQADLDYELTMQKLGKSGNTGSTKGNTPTVTQADLQELQNIADQFNEVKTQSKGVSGESVLDPYEVVSSMLGNFLANHKNWTEEMARQYLSKYLEPYL